MKSAHDGDTISLNAGTYSGLNINQANFASGVTITSVDPTHAAVITDFQVNSSSGLNFSKLEFQVNVQGPAWGVLVENSKNISFDHVNVHGSMDGNPQDDGEGIGALFSSNISITNSEFQQLCRGVGFGTGSDLTISGDNFHDLQTTGVMVAQAARATITNNSFTNFKIMAGDHPDAIQFLSTGATSASHDITISGNLINRGAGDGIQGIFLRDEAGNLPYANVNISDNMLIGAGYNGVAVLHGQNLAITNNTLISYAGDTSVNWLLVQNADTVTASGNSAVSIGFDKVTNLVETGDIHSVAVTDGGAAALAVWMAAHPGVGAGLGGAGGGVGISSAGGGGQFLTGDAGANHLTGGAGADTLDGGKGNDTLTGGGGADVFHFSPGSGTDMVMDFGVGGHDVLDISAYLKAGLNPTFHDVGVNVGLTFSNGDGIVLMGVHSWNLHATSVGFTL